MVYHFETVQQKILLLLAKRHDALLSDDKVFHLFTGGYHRNPGIDHLSVQITALLGGRCISIGRWYRHHEHHDGQRHRENP